MFDERLKIRTQATALIRTVAKVILRSVFEVLPVKLNSFVGQLGYTTLIKRSAGVRYAGSAFGTKYKILAQGNYAVERNATSRGSNGEDPFWAFSSLGLKNFVMLDIGANVGTYSIGAAGIGAKAIYSIEPGPLFEKLKTNVEFNGLQSVITPIQIGLAKQAGRLRWYEDKNNPGNAHLVASTDSISLENLSTKFGDEFVEVEVLTLDELSKSTNFPKIDFIKIDVEGMEWEVLSAGSQLIESSRPIVIAETHRMASDMMKYDCLTPMFNYFYSLGYESFSFESGKLKKFIYPNFSIDTFFIPKS